MKKLMPGGYTLTVGQPRFNNANKHDPWPSHATLFEAAGVEVLGSGRWAVDFAFALKDLSEYRYIWKIVDTEAEGLRLQASYAQFVTRDGLQGYYGEWYNFVPRAQTLEKVSFLDWPAWNLAH